MSTKKTCDHTGEDGIPDCKESAYWEFKLVGNIRRACKKHEPTHLTGLDLKRV